MITKPSFIVRGPTPLVRLNSSGARNRNQIQINFQNFSYYAKKGLFLGFCFKVLQEIWHLRICTPRHMLKLLDPGCLELKWTSCRFSLSFGPLLHSFEASIFKYLPQRTGTAPTSRLELERMPANRQVFLPSSQFHDSIKPDFFGENRWWESLFFGGLPKNSWEIREPKFISNLAGSLLKTNTSVLWSAFLRQPYIHHWAICSLDPRGNPSYLRKSMLQNWFK